MRAMARKLPKLCLHRATGRGYVTDPWTKKEHYFPSPYGTAACVAEYQAWAAALEGRRAEVASGAPPGASVTVFRLVADYLEHAGTYYRKHGKRTSEYLTLKQALCPLRELFGGRPAASIGPSDLKAVRQAMLALGWAREHTNEQVGRVRRCFRWGVEVDLVPGTVLAGLDAVAPLKKGRTTAREAEPVKPVPRERVWAALPHLKPLFRALVQMHWHTGARAEDVVVCRPCDLGPVEADGLRLFVPWTHKTEHIDGSSHEVWLNAPAQEAVAALLAAAPAPDAWLFPSRGRGRNHRYRGHVTVSGYRQALEAACGKAVVVPHFYPLQIRHSFLTAARALLGLDAAQAAGGHKHADTTAIYASVSRELARKVAREMGGFVP
jgi:integrase